MNVEIVVAESAGAVVVPRAAVFRDGEKRFVLVPDSSRAVRRDVTAGLVGLDEVEIRAGLKEGDVVLLPGGAALTPGARLAKTSG